jgi:hypothetical protein
VIIHRSAARTQENFCRKLTPQCACSATADDVLYSELGLWSNRASPRPSTLPINQAFCPTFHRFFTGRFSLAGFH